MSGGKLHFTKMHGCGNDYIYFNCFEDPVESPEKLAVRLSDRHKGVGGDGVILICPPEAPENDARMRMFNLDGSEGKMCGNGIRCVAKFVYDSGIARKRELKIETLSGVKTCLVHEKDGKAEAVTVDMGKAVLRPEEIPVKLSGEAVIGRKVTVAGEEREITCCSMGNPHCTVFVPSVDKLDLSSLGPKFEKDPLFPQGVNAGFVEVIDEHTLKARIWEKGSGETMACGTGTCAAVVAAVLNGYCKQDRDIRVLLKGGELTMNYTGGRVLMTGRAEKVYDGVVEI